jgi:alpha-beta hydrolase superfamily lysophospholipase
MVRRRHILIGSLIAAATGPTRAAEAVTALSLRAEDGVEVTGELRKTAPPKRGTVLLFHQAGTNFAEYAPIAPRLVTVGFDTLAIDQRSGGTAYGRRNETVARIGHDPGYGAALPDLEATFAYARKDNAGDPILLWGSSYSASFVFLLAAAHPGEVAALLAFSPGEYISGTSIRAAAAKVTCPVFVTSASNPEEESAAAAIFGAVTAKLKRQYRPQNGVHGSATLRADRNPAGAEANWQAVIAFLDAAVPPPR